MKKIIFLIAIFLSFQLFFTSCEKKANFPWPDDIENGVIATIDLLEQEEGVDPSKFDFNDLNNASAKFEIKTPYDEEYSSLNLMVVTKLKGEKAYDFGKQYKIAEYSKPGIYNVTFPELINVIDVYNTTDDVTKSDKLKFFVNVVTKSGKILYAFLPLVRPTLDISVEQETSATTSKVYKIVPGKSSIGDFFEFKIDNSNATRVKATVSTKNQDSILIDIVNAIDDKIALKPTGKWATMIQEYSAKDGFVEVKGNVNTDFELTGTANLKDAEVSGYGPNILAHEGYNFSANIIIK